MTGVQTCALPICRIVEQGSHAELLALGGHYAALWKHQSGGFLALDIPEPALASIDDGAVDDERAAAQTEPGTDDQPAVRA